MSCDRRVTARIADAISPIHIFSIGESKVDTVVMGCKIKPFIESYFTKHSSPTLLLNIVPLLLNIVSNVSDFNHRIIKKKYIP